MASPGLYLGLNIGQLCGAPIHAAQEQPRSSQERSAATMHQITRNSQEQSGTRQTRKGRQ